MKFAYKMCIRDRAGRDLSDLIILGLLGVSMMTAGIIGINRKER